MNALARDTVATVRAHRAFGLAHPRRRLPRQVLPFAIEREYAKAILSVLENVRRQFEPFFAQLPDILARNALSRSDSVHLDAGEGKRVQDLLEQAKRRLTNALGSLELAAVAERFAQRISQHQRIQFGRQAKAALGIDIAISDRKVNDLIEGFVAENVALIKDVPERLAAEIGTATTRAVANGTLHRQLAVELNERIGIAKNRARLIARDQIGKLYGQINHARQKELGVTAFYWRTVGDDRVRDEHMAREGQRFEYSDPPSDGLPGQPVLCRCWAEPDFTDINAAT